MLQAVILAIGRVLMASLFASAALPFLKREQGQRKLISSVGIPAVRILQPAAGVCLLTGALMLAFGCWARIAAALLAIFVLLVTPLFHRFWTINEQPQRMLKLQAFLANVGVIGGLLAFIAAGSGPLAIIPAS